MKQIKDCTEVNTKRIDLGIVMISDEFFEFLPKVQKNYGNRKSVIDLNDKEGVSSNNFSKLIRSGSIMMNSGIGSRSLSEFLNFNSAERSHLTSFRANSKLRQGNKEDNSSLTFNQIQLMEAKIFTPHMISYGMIIHYGGDAQRKNFEQLSLMEIIQK